MKGCPLRCPWCANPETFSKKKEILFWEKDCVSCGVCVKSCKEESLTWINNSIIRDEKSCNMCMDCVNLCQKSAFLLSGMEYTVEEVFEEVTKDMAFYRKSGGGVTLSGGEPLLQKEFTLAILKRFKEGGIHTTLETTGVLESESFLEVLSHVDLLYMDFKHPNKEIHEKITGVSNEFTIKNMRLAKSSQKDVVIRIPVIPRFNYSVEVAKEYVTVLKDIGLENVHLLPFHQMGKGKWEAMGKDYTYGTEKSLCDEDLEEIAKIFREAGFETQIGG